MLASSRKILTAIVVAGLTTAATVAIAQQAAAPAGQEKQGSWAGHEHHHMMPSQMVEARLAYMKTALQITPAQSAQWEQLAGVLRKQAKARDAKFAEMQQKMEAMKNGGDKERPDPIAMMEHREKMLTEAAANMAEFVAAAKPLYASFSDSQKEIAGEVLGHHGHGGMRGGWGHGGER
jgi:hypothetical protein